jgi:hypothetical protein
VQAAYYPILSESHPFFQKIQSLAESGELEDGLNPDLLKPDTVAVLVKTEAYSTVGDVPVSIEHKDAVQGLVINAVRDPAEEEARLIRENFPAIDLEKLIVLEEGRTPSSVLSYLLFMGGGAALILLAVASFIMGRADK